MIGNNRIIKVYVVRLTIDEYGRTPGIIGVTLLEEEAKRMAKNKGWFGSDASIAQQHAVFLNKREGKAVLLLESPTEYPLSVDIPEVQQEKRREALANLTPEEIELLGIKEK